MPLMLGKNSAVEGISQSLNGHFSGLEALFSGADSIPKLTLYHRNGCLRLPPLAIYSIKPSLQDQFLSGDPLRIFQAPSTTNRRDDIALCNIFSIKSTICQTKPSSFSGEFLSPTGCPPFEQTQKHGITAWSFRLANSQYHLRTCSNCISCFSPKAVSSPCSGEIICAFVSFSEACRVKADELFLD